MKLIYIANVRMPTEKAHGIQIMKTCESLADLGVTVELWVPRRRNAFLGNRDPFEFYGVKKNFAIRYFWCLDLIGLVDFFPGLGYRVQSGTFTWSLKRALSEKSGFRSLQRRAGKSGATNAKDLKIYSRDLEPLVACQSLGLEYFYEIHTIAANPKPKFLRMLRSASGVVAISENLISEVSKYLPESKVLLARDGVDLGIFSKEIDKSQARMDLGFPKDSKIALYTGHLYEWKGARVLAQAAESLSKNIEVYLVGGTDADLQNFRKFLNERRLERCRALGQVDYSLIPKYLAAADVLILPNSGKFEISRSHTSPLKLFEYMAARRPIVASDLPSLREVLDETCAVFFVPDDPLSLARKIESLISDVELCENLSVNAARRVGEYSWQARARLIEQFIFSR